MAFVVLYDANVLYGNEVRDLLIRVARSGLVRAYWSNAILDEMIRNAAANRPDISGEKWARLRELMNAAVPGALVEGYEGLIDGIKLPDPDDRHVVAAAIRCGAEVIVTSNLRDFPAAALAPYGLEAKGPDDFVLDQLGLAESTLRSCVHQIAEARNRPPKTFAEILDALERAGLVESAATLRDLEGAPGWGLLGWLVWRGWGWGGVI
ncbi:PIN domain-containing protein [Actinocorallia sp. A-T 12471]|uniref:PIN domain-containing protein n=1 Tax=Actinocorallia sp. A-T 12471 TaxID=3089813 RepID=UPI0029CF790E|nr:PIN domain-containing protein [Actinocorallia sp. A-T 12471]MDX6744469.1 PIN domain-containing protein [Actinocorallia sp. A-T 12471]